MTERDDMQLQALFAAAMPSLSDAEFTARMVSQLERHERQQRLLTRIQTGVLLGVPALLGLFIEERLLARAGVADLGALLAQHPWWLAGLIAVVCLLPPRAAGLFASRPS